MRYSRNVWNPWREVTLIAVRPGLPYSLFNRGMNCEECLGGIKAAIDQLLSDEFVSGIMDTLSGDGFCGMQENEEACIKIIHELIPYALPSLKNGIDSEQTLEIFNMAVPDTCPAI